MAGRESRERPASGAARDYRLKRFELKTENRSRNNGSGQRFIASNGDSRHPTAESKKSAPFGNWGEYGIMLHAEMEAGFTSEVKS